MAFLVLEGVLLPVLAPLVLALLPQRWQSTGARVLGPRPLPKSLLGWLAVLAAVLVGAMTHLLWDGFTHAWMWPARALYPGVSVPVFGQPVLLSRVLQHLSSFLGVVIVTLYLVWSAPPRPAGVPMKEPSRASALRQLALLFLVPVVGGAVAGALKLRHPHPLFSRTLWDAGWAAVAWFALLLGIGCLVVRFRRARPPRD